MQFSSIICVADDYDENVFTLCINNDRNLFSFGYSTSKAHGHKEIMKIPTQINTLSNIRMIDCGDYHSLFLNYDGDVYSLGDNDRGQLGIVTDEFKQTHIPQKINLPHCKQVSCGNEFSICLSDNDELYSFGHNDKGQLGLGNYNKSYSSPQLIPDLNNIEFIVCGGYHTICKTYNNEYYSWGDNENGQLGNNGEHNKPIQCLNWPDNIIAIKCGGHHSLLLTLEGQVYSFGCNYFGQLGLNDKNIESTNIPILIIDIPEIQRIECGYNHSMLIDINNNLWLFGFNYFGQLGVNDGQQVVKPIQHPTLSNIIDISSRGIHTFVKTSDNKIYAFGKNNHSQLSIKTSKERQLTPIQVFQDNEDIWCSFIGKSRAKSARK